MTAGTEYLDMALQGKSRVAQFVAGFCIDRTNPWHSFYTCPARILNLDCVFHIAPWPTACSPLHVALGDLDSLCHVEEALIAVTLIRLDD
jgi:hypothetical protein